MKIAMAQPNVLIQLSSRLASRSGAKKPKPMSSTPEKQPNALEKAVNEDFQKIRKELAKAIRRICPAWLSSQSEDLIQAAIMRLLDLHRRNPERQFNATYLWKTAYSALVDEIRRSRRQEIGFSEDSQEDETPFLGPGPESRLKARQIGTGIRECLLDLSESRRAAVTLYLQGYNVPESAELLGWSRKKAENTVYRGLKELRGRLQLKGIQP